MIRTARWILKIPSSIDITLEVYGGKFSVIMDDFRRWFLGLWQGKSLAVIIACTTIIICFGFFYAANLLSQRPKPDAHNENDYDSKE